ELEKEVQALRQLHARSVVKEIDVRRKAGQHELARTLLEKFPPQDVAGETLAQVSEMLGEYREEQKKIAQVLSELEAHIAAVNDTAQRKECQALLEELTRELGPNTIGRMASYLR